MNFDYEAQLTKDDLPDHIIYDNVDPYEPTYKPSAPNFQSTMNSNVNNNDKTKTETSHQIPHFPHSSYVKDGKRIYEYSRTTSDTEKSEMWKNAVDDVSVLLKNSK